MSVYTGNSSIKERTIGTLTHCVNAVLNTRLNRITFGLLSRRLLNTVERANSIKGRKLLEDRKIDDILHYYYVTLLETSTYTHENLNHMF